MESILSDKLKSFDYYKKKLPLYLQNSYGFAEHFRIWQEVLKDSVVKTADEILELINIFDEDYSSYIEEFKSNTGCTKIQMLDFLAELFGQQRTFKYNDDIITLTDDELLKLIKVQIIKNYFSGTKEDLLKLYESIGLRIAYQTNGAANCNIYLIRDDSATDQEVYTNNILAMFRMGMLAIESLGISYTYSIINNNAVLIWDTSNWDEGEWAI